MIRLQDVTKVYEGGTVAVRDVSLDIQRGEFVFLVGPSGSGKSTLIRLMLRQEPITRGTIWVAGKDITQLPNWKVPYLRRSIGTVFQDFKLLPNKTVAENIAFTLEVLGRPRSVIKPQVDQVLDLVGLEGKADRYPRQLSGGEQQRVSVARAFVNRPPILLADEPTGNLDPATSVGIMKLLDRINRTGTTIVMATHDHAIVDAMQRRVVAVADGVVVRDDASGRYDTTMQNAVTAAASTVAAPPGQPVGVEPLDISEVADAYEDLAKHAGTDLDSPSEPAPTDAARTDAASTDPAPAEHEPAEAPDDDDVPTDASDDPVGKSE